MRNSTGSAGGLRSSPARATRSCGPRPPPCRAAPARAAAPRPAGTGSRSAGHRPGLRPTPYFLQWTSHPVYSPVHRMIDQQHPQWPYQCEKNYPCNGPFELKINQPGQGYQLVKNPLYWNTEDIKLNQIILTPVTPAQAIQAFQKEEIDWVGNPFGGWHPFYISGNEDHVFSSPNYCVCWCVFNTAYVPFQNRKLRQAFAYAIERAKIVADAYLPLKPAYSALLPHYSENYPPPLSRARWGKSTPALS